MTLICYDVQAEVTSVHSSFKFKKVPSTGKKLELFDWAGVSLAD